MFAAKHGVLMMVVRPCLPDILLHSSQAVNSDWQSIGQILSSSGGHTVPPKRTPEGQLPAAKQGVVIEIDLCCLPLVCEQVFHASQL